MFISSFLAYIIATYNIYLQSTNAVTATELVNIQLKMPAHAVAVDMRYIWTIVDCSPGELPFHIRGESP